MNMRRKIVFACLLFGCCASAPTEDCQVPNKPIWERSIKGWQNNVTLVSNNTSPGGLISLMNANFTDVDGTSEANIYTIQFAINQSSARPAPVQPGPNPFNPSTPITPPSATPPFIRVQAIVNWIIEGSQIQRIFDVGNGTTISGGGSGVNIRLQDLTNTLPGLTGTNNVSYDVACSIVKGTRAQFQTPVVFPASADPTAPLIGNFSLAPAGSLNFTVPKNAGIISVKITVTDITTRTSRPTFVQASQQTGGTTYLTWIPDDEPLFMPLIPGTQLVQVSNFSGADTVQIAVIWGVDG